MAEKQLVQEAIAESYAQIEQFRLFVLRTAWKIDQGNGYTPEVRREIAIAKVLSAKVIRDVVERAVHLHGALGTSNETPLANLWMLVPGYGIWDGPTESHVSTAARLLLRDYSPSPGLWPTQWLPALRDSRRETIRHRPGGAGRLGGSQPGGYRRRVTSRLPVAEPITFMAGSLARTPFRQQVAAAAGAGSVGSPAGRTSGGTPSAGTACPSPTCGACSTMPGWWSPMSTPAATGRPHPL